MKKRKPYEGLMLQECQFFRGNIVQWFDVFLSIVMGILLTSLTVLVVLFTVYVATHVLSGHGL